MNRAKKLINKHDRVQLEDALQYLSVAELRTLLEEYNLPVHGKKAGHIETLLHFLDTGKVQQAPVMPVASKAHRGKQYPLHPDTPMLFGSYKNDHATRALFKQLVGNHFHFTAFGIDWLEDRWYAGNPPTYREFAEFWQQEYARRKRTKAEPKREWAYINFTQRLLEQFPNVSRQKITAAWKMAREEKVRLVQDILQK